MASTALEGCAGPSAEPAVGASVFRVGLDTVWELSLFELWAGDDITCSPPEEQHGTGDNGILFSTGDGKVAASFV